MGRTKKKKDIPFLIAILIWPFLLVDLCLKILIGVPIGLFMSLVDYSKKRR